jgi:Fe-S-cluster-containing dehydrogenase component
MCEDAPCITACSSDAIYTRDDGLVIIDIKKCTGCQLVLMRVHMAVYSYNAKLQLAQKCTGCAHLIDRGEVFAPNVPIICFHEAINLAKTLS